MFWRVLQSILLTLNNEGVYPDVTAGSATGSLGGALLMVGCVKPVFGDGEYQKRALFELRGICTEQQEVPESVCA